MWNDLTMKERADLIKQGVALGYKDIDAIRSNYHTFSKGSTVYTDSNPYYNRLPDSKKKEWRSLSARRQQFLKLMQQYAPQLYNDSQLRNVMEYIAFNEGRWGNTGISKQGARGYFQLMPDTISTARRSAGKNYNVNNPADDFAMTQITAQNSMKYIQKLWQNPEFRRKAEEKGYTPYDLLMSSWLAGPTGMKNNILKGTNPKDAYGTSINNYVGNTDSQPDAKTMVINTGIEGKPVVITSSPEVEEAIRQNNIPNDVTVSDVPIQQDQDVSNTYLLDQYNRILGDNEALRGQYEELSEQERQLKERYEEVLKEQEEEDQARYLRSLLNVGRTTPIMQVPALGTISTQSAGSINDPYSNNNILAQQMYGTKMGNMRNGSFGKYFFNNPEERTPVVVNYNPYSPLQGGFAYGGNVHRFDKGDTVIVRPPLQAAQNQFAVPEYHYYDNWDPEQFYPTTKIGNAIYDNFDANAPAEPIQSYPNIGEVNPVYQNPTVKGEPVKILHRVQNNDQQAVAQYQDGELGIVNLPDNYWQRYLPEVVVPGRMQQLQGVIDQANEGKTIFEQQQDMEDAFRYQDEAKRAQQDSFYNPRAILDNTSRIPVIGALPAMSEYAYGMLKGGPEGQYWKDRASGAAEEQLLPIGLIAANSNPVTAAMADSALLGTSLYDIDRKGLNEENGLGLAMGLMGPVGRGTSILRANPAVSQAVADIKDNTVKAAQVAKGYLQEVPHQAHNLRDKANFLYRVYTGNEMAALNQRRWDTINKVNEARSKRIDEAHDKVKEARSRLQAVYRAQRRANWDNPGIPEKKQIKGVSVPNKPQMPNFPAMGRDNIENYFEKAGVPKEQAKEWAAKYDEGKKEFIDHVTGEVPIEGYDPVKGNAVTTGNVSITDLETGKTNMFYLDPKQLERPGKEIASQEQGYRPEHHYYWDSVPYVKTETRVVSKGASARLNPTLPKEYQEALQKNMDYVTKDPEMLPGSKAFGSTTNIVEGNIYHGSHDIDVIMTAEQARNNKHFGDFQIHIKNNDNPSIVETYKWYHPNAGKDGIDVNIINEDKGMAYGQRAHEIYAQLFPKEYREYMREKIKGLKEGEMVGTDIKLNKSAQELLDAYNPVEKGIIDTLASSKDKHTMRAYYYLNYGKVKDVQNALTKYINYLMGGGYKPVRVPLSEFADADVNAVFIDELGLKGINKEQFIHDPERMQLLLDYAVYDKMFLGRGVTERPEAPVWRQLLEWYEDTTNGTANGVGNNAVLGGDSGHGSLYATIIPRRMKEVTGSTPKQVWESAKEISDFYGEPLSIEDINKIQDIAASAGIDVGTPNSFKDVLDATRNKRGKAYKDFISKLAEEFDIPMIVGSDYGHAPYVSILEDQTGDAIKQVFLNRMDRPQTVASREARAAGAITDGSTSPITGALHDMKNTIDQRLHEREQRRSQDVLGIEQGPSEYDALVRREATAQKKYNEAYGKEAALYNDPNLRHDKLMDKYNNTIDAYIRRLYDIKRTMKKIVRIGRKTLIGLGAAGLGTAIYTKSKEAQERREQYIKQHPERVRRVTQNAGSSRIGITLPEVQRVGKRHKTKRTSK